MAENKPITFKSKAPAKKMASSTKPVADNNTAKEAVAEQKEEKSIQEQLEESIANIASAKASEENKPVVGVNATQIPTVEATETDWEKKIAEAKTAEAEKKEEELSIAEAAANIAKEAEKDKAVTVTAEPPAETDNIKVKTEVKKEETKEEDSEFRSYWDQDAGSEPVEGNAVYTASDEELARAEAIKGKKEADASRVLTCQLGSESEFTKAFETIKSYMEKFKNLTKEDIDANPEIKSYIQWLADLNAISDSSLNTDQQRLLLGMISALNKHNVFLQKLDRKLNLSKVNAGLQATGAPKLLRGNAAIQMINNRYRGVYKIQLNNSGFWIKATPLRNIDVDAWMQEVDFGRKQIGRLVGGHFYLGMNIYLKEKLADLLKLTVVDSNLEKWNEGNTLVDSISIHDYDTLCWAFSTMMHKDGVFISTVCVNPECKHHDEAQYIDLARCAYVNPDVFNEEAVKWMLEGSAPGVIRTQKDIKNYKENILKNIRKVKFTNTDEYVLKDPSLGEFIRVGMSTLGKLAAKVKDGKLDNDSEEVRRYAVYHLTKMLSPWINKIVLNDESGKTVGVIDDRDAITQSLETSMDDEFHVIERIEEFMTTSKVSFYTVFSLKCPHCGHQPNLLKDNLFPLDVEYVLFCLCYLKLEQIGVEL